MTSNPCLTPEHEEVLQAMECLRPYPWETVRGGLRVKFDETGRHYCPVCALNFVLNGDERWMVAWINAACALGVGYAVAGEIACAADQPTHWLRPALKRALGL